MKEINYISKKNTLFGAIGSILLICGALGTFALAIRDVSIYIFIVPLFAVILGVIAIALAMGD